MGTLGVQPCPRIVRAGTVNRALLVHVFDATNAAMIATTEESVAANEAMT